jgi:GMP synthase (glutamine-hydrolysing)
VREIGVFSELVPFDTPLDTVRAMAPRGIILSGGPASVYDEGAPPMPDWVIRMGVPVLGICYGMQLLAHSLGGRVAPAQSREYGLAELQRESGDDPLMGTLPERQQVWMSHGDRVEALPPGFRAVGHSRHSPYAVMGDRDRALYAVQFHPEVVHTPHGSELLRNFVVDICGCRTDWTPAHFVQSAIEEIRAQAPQGRILVATSGGVDSSVAAVLVHRAVGEMMTALFIDHGLLREGEAAEVRQLFADLGLPVRAVDASARFLGALEGIEDPEEKRRRVGETFIRVFEDELAHLGRHDYLVQGTLYPDVIESASTAATKAAHKIKTHHNVGGLPTDHVFTIIEPLRLLFKDEVRAVGRELGLPEHVVERQPFPGPGLAVRIIGPVTADALATVRGADAVVRREIEAARSDLGDAFPWQFFAVLTPLRSVGVMGDKRTYGNLVAIRAVTSRDGMTADWARLPHALLARMATTIVNEVTGVNRVAYDITSKPPATIEWE